MPEGCPRAVIHLFSLIKNRLNCFGGIAPRINQANIFNIKIIMKKFLFLSLLVSIFAFNACKDDDSATKDPSYHIHIETPDSADKAIGEALQIKVNFEDQNGGIVHHVNVRIYNKDTNTEIYNKPTTAHVHSSKAYLFEDTLPLTEGGTWVLEAMVWGEEDGTFEVMESVEFKVN